MNRYALLILPSANRVYAEASVGLTRAELSVFSATVLGGAVDEIDEAVLGGVPYVTFAAPRLDARAVAYLSNLSSVYALFELDDSEGDTRLRPLTLTPLDTFDDDLLTIQKYAGKTNELFTKLLLNVTALSSAFADEMLDRRLHVLDPLCGRGTTLNQALMYGYDASGIEVDGKDVEAYSGFIRTYLKRKRLKHHAEFAPLRRDRKVVGRRLHVTLGASKEAYKAGDTLSLTVVNADTTRAREIFRPRSFHLVVTDLPYGVQHGSRTPPGGVAAPTLSRRPVELLRAAVPGWAELLRPGGAIGLSWNTFVAKREDAAQLLEDAGLVVCASEPYLGFRHRVDQAIVRDIVVARKP